MVFRDVLDAISAYTGLSPVAFFTVAALLLTVFYVVSSFLAPPPPPPPLARYEPPPPPVQLGDEVTEAELKAYDGSDPAKPLLMAIKGQIYDVSQSRMFYGPGGPYALFAGKDASRALAKMSFEEADLTGNIEGLNAMEIDALQDWEWKFMTKYVKVGQLKSNKSKSSEAALSQDQGQGQDVSTKEGEGESNESPSSEVLSGQVGENGKTDQKGEENGKEENGQKGQESGLLGSVKDEETQDSSGVKSREVHTSADDDSVTSNGTVKPEKQEE